MFSCSFSLTWCRRATYTWHEVSGGLWILLITFTFLRLIIYEEWNIDDWLVSQIKGWDLGCSRICLYFCDSCLLCWFSEMHKPRKILKISSSIHYLIIHSLGNEIRLLQWSEMCLSVTMPAFLLCSNIFESGALSMHKTFSLFFNLAFHFLFSLVQDHRMTVTCYSLSP